MRAIKKELLSKILTCVRAISIPLLLLILGIQAKSYAELSKEVSDLEKKQEQLVEENKKLISDISLLSSTDRIEKIATEELGMHKAETSDIVRVQMAGGNNEFK